jgi:hypothetical protein
MDADCGVLALQKYLDVGSPLYKKKLRAVARRLNPKRSENI